MRPFYSICIPCFKRIEQLRNTLNSIYYDNDDVDISEYEVIISDNDPSCDVKLVIAEFADKENLHYFSTNCDGFMNSYYVLTFASGEFLKLHNSQNKFRKGSLSKLIQQVRSCRKERPVLFYTNGFLRKHTSCRYTSFDDFMFELSYWSSWSGGFNIWKDEFDKVNGIELNKLFPQTSLLLTQVNAGEYIINDNPIYEIQRISKRGGHNKFRAFTVDYPSLVYKSFLEGRISNRSKKRIFKLLYTEFIPTLLFNKYIIRIERFDASAFKANTNMYFPSYAYWLSYICILLVPFRLLIRRMYAMRYYFPKFRQ